MVVLPDPVGPVTRTSPRGRAHKSANTGGVPNSLKFKSLAGINRKAMATLPLLEIDTRNRPWSPNANPKSDPPTSCNSCWHRSGEMLFISDIVSSGVKTFVSSAHQMAVMPNDWRLTDGNVKIAGARLTTVCSSLSIRILAMIADPRYVAVPGWGDCPNYRLSENGLSPLIVSNARVPSGKPTPRSTANGRRRHERSCPLAADTTASLRAGTRLFAAQRRLPKKSCYFIQTRSVSPPARLPPAWSRREQPCRCRPNTAFSFPP